jgi:hypothetical protein
MKEKQKVKNNQNKRKDWRRGKRKKRMIISFIFPFFFRLSSNISSHSSVDGVSPSPLTPFPTLLLPSF